MTVRRKLSTQVISRAKQERRKTKILDLAKRNTILQRVLGFTGVIKQLQSSPVGIMDRPHYPANMVQLMMIPATTQPTWTTHYPATNTVSNCNSCHVASLPMMIPDLPSQPQALQMGVSGALGNTSQQCNVVLCPHIGTTLQAFDRGEGSAPQPNSVCIQGGFPVQAQHMGMHARSVSPPQLQFMTMQGGLASHELATGGSAVWRTDCQSPSPKSSGFECFGKWNYMPYEQQQRQQLVPNFGALPAGNFPWLLGSVSPSNILVLPWCLLGKWGKVGPIRCHLGVAMRTLPQGNVALGSEQSHGQASATVNQCEVRPSSMQFSGRKAGMQFNMGRSSKGRRP